MEFSRFLNRLLLLFLFLGIILAGLMWSPVSPSPVRPAVLPAIPDPPLAVMSVPEAALFKARIEEELLSGRAVTITEAELNRFLAAALQGQQSFLLDPWVQVRAVQVDLSEESFRLRLERDVIGLRHEVALDYAVESELIAGTIRRRTFKPTGGKIGRLLLPAFVASRLSGWTSTLGSETKELWGGVMKAAGVIEIQQEQLIFKPQPNRVF